MCILPGHPIAGTERSGPDAGFAELFEGRWCILTPLENTDPDVLDRLCCFWQACGSNIDIMDHEHHDRVLAIVSHLPQLISYNIVGTASDMETVTSSEVIKYSASGFRDFTRLAASDPTMWRDVCLHNKDAILEMLARFSEDLSSLQKQFVGARVRNYMIYFRAPERFAAQLLKRVRMLMYQILTSSIYRSEPIIWTITGPIKYFIR